MFFLTGPSREALAGGEDLAKLVEFLGDKKSTDLHVLGVEVLGLCLYAADSMTILHSSGLLQQLLTYITDSNDPNMKKQATLTLARIATDGEGRNTLSNYVILFSLYMCVVEALFC